MFASKVKVPVFLMILVFTLMTCADESPEHQDYEQLRSEAIKNEIILKIGDLFYDNSDFEKYLLLTVGDSFEELSELSRSRLLDSFIEEKLLLEAARRERLFLSDEEKKGYLARLSNEFKLSENMIKKEVEVNTLFEKLLIEKITLGLVKDIDVTPEEIQEYYQLNKKDYLQNEKRRVSQILLRTEDKAIEIYKRVKEFTEEEFRKIAREESKGVEASRGGMMGVFELGQLPEEMDKVVFSLKQGQVSQVIESEYGYHIFRIDEIIKSSPLPDKPDQDVSSRIEMKILNQKISDRMNKYLEKLKSDLDWEFYPERLNFTYQRNEYE